MRQQIDGIVPPQARTDRLPRGFRVHVPPASASVIAPQDDLPLVASATLMRGDALGSSYTVWLRLAVPSSDAATSRLLHLADAGIVRDAPVRLRIGWRSLEVLR